MISVSNDILYFHQYRKIIYVFHSLSQISAQSRHFYHFLYRSRPFYSTPVVNNLPFPHPQTHTPWSKKNPLTILLLNKNFHIFKNCPKILPICNTFFSSGCKKCCKKNKIFFNQQNAMLIDITSTK